MNRKQTRYLRSRAKREEKRNAKDQEKFNEYVEMLGAAFIRETGLNPTETRLCAEEKDGVYSYWFEKLEREDVPTETP